MVWGCGVLCTEAGGSSRKSLQPRGAKPREALSQLTGILLFGFVRHASCLAEKSLSGMQRHARPRPPLEARGAAGVRFCKTGQGGRLRDAPRVSSTRSLQRTADFLCTSRAPTSVVSCLVCFALRLVPLTWEGGALSPASPSNFKATFRLQGGERAVVS